MTNISDEQRFLLIRDAGHVKVRGIQTDEEWIIASAVCRVLGLTVEKENEHGHEDEKA
jgi:prophage antirepressor-like protein